MISANEIVDIQSHLHSICDERGLRPVAARGYGSRARNLDSADSDYDVMVVFANDPADHAAGTATYSFERQVSADASGLDTEIEFSGWSLQKFVGSGGIAGSNPTAIEFCLSPDRYYTDSGIRRTDYLDEMLEHAVKNFKPYALINHYRSMAAGQYGKYIEGDYKLSSGTSDDDLIEHINIGWKELSEDALSSLEVDAGRTTIGDEIIEVFGHGIGDFGGTIDTDAALDDGLIEPTTTEPSTKRYLNVVQALLRARVVEETHDAPVPMDFPEFCYLNRMRDWFGGDIRTDTWGLMREKWSGTNDEHRRPTLDDWIEAELGREIEPGPHVQRAPDKPFIRAHGRNIYRTLYNL